MLMLVENMLGVFDSMMLWVLVVGVFLIVVCSFCSKERLSVLIGGWVSWSLMMVLWWMWLSMVVFR